MKTLLSILLALVGIVSANSGDTLRYDTLGYGRDTCGGSKVCRLSQIKIHLGISSVPVASSSTLGGVKQGAGTTIAGDGTISVAGTVSSVGLSAPANMTASGSPVTGSGSLSLAWNGSASNLVQSDGSTRAVTSLNPTTTIGDIPYATSTATPAALGRLADVATGSVMVSGGVGAAPTYSSTPSLTTVTAKGLAQTVQTVAISTTPAVNLASGNIVIIGASGIPGALTAATTITFSNPTVGATTSLSFQQGTTSFAVTFTIAGYTFYQNGKTAGVASGSAVLQAADMTLSQFYTVEITWLSATTAAVALLKS